MRMIFMKNLLISIIFAAGALILLPGCHLFEQQVIIQPKLSVSPSSMGQNKTIYLSVIDERPASDLGVRGIVSGTIYEFNTVGNAVISSGQNVGNAIAEAPGGDILIQNDLEKVVTDAFKIGLEAKGFRVTESLADHAEQKLKVRIQSLQYRARVGFFTCNNITFASIQITQFKDSQTWTKTFKYETEDAKSWHRSTAGKNRKIINRCVQDLLNNIFKDQDFLNHLAQEGNIIGVKEK
jgi:uncharacterized lipoprotein YajG